MLCEKNREAPALSGAGEYKEANMEDGIIKIDTERAKEFGFTSDKYLKCSYLWKLGDCIWISFIETRKHGQGYFSQLLNNIKAKEYYTVVPTPLGIMPKILEKKGFGWGIIEEDGCEYMTDYPPSEKVASEA